MADFDNIRHASILKSLFLGLCGLFVLASCNNTKYLAENEYLLKKNVIEINSDLNIEKKSNLAYELKTLTKQQPNSKFLGTFQTRLWMHNRLNKTEDKLKAKGASLKKFKGWIKRKVSEPPTIFSPRLTEETAESIQYYLNNKGYFNAEVKHHEMFYDSNKVKVTYNVRLNKALKVKEVIEEIKDEELTRIIQADKENTFLKKGSPVSNNLFDQEKSRLTLLLRNKGYAYFYPNYLKFISYDSTNYEASISTTILPPNDGGEHEVYSIGDVYIYPNYSPAIDEMERLDTLDVGNGYYFLKKEGEKMKVKPKTILNAIFLQKDSIFSQETYDISNKKLGNLGIYKFVTIKYEKNRFKRNEITVRIYLTPRKKQEIGYSFELYTSNRTNSSGTGLGVGADVTYRNRNLFKGAEIFQVTLEGGAEFALNSDEANILEKLINSYNYSAKTDLYFPKFVVPFPIQRSIKNKSPKTRLSLEASGQKIFDSYTERVFSSAFGYDWQSGSHVRHVLSPVAWEFVNIIDTAATFVQVLEANPYIANSFSDNFFLGGNYSFFYTGPTRRNGSSWFFKAYTDVSGNSLSVLDLVAKPNADLQLFGLDYSHFIRGELDLRYYNNTSRRSTFAARIATSAGHSWNTQTLPYVKQYSVGGANSIRAWLLRDLGPGGYINTDTLDVSYQAGDFRLEGSAEFRFDIFWTLEGAFFMDFGNIWTLRTDESRLNSNLTSDFLKQIAIGIGYGLRFDFSYFVFRVDFGYRLKSPYRLGQDETGSYFYPQGFKFKYRDNDGILRRRGQFNIGVGYPF